MTYVNPSTQSILPQCTKQRYLEGAGPIYVIDLSNHGLAPVGALLDGDSQAQSLPKAGAAVVYILAHGLPDNLVFGDQKLPDRDIATYIQEARRGAPTLIVWDVCYAETFYALQPEEKVNADQPEKPTHEDFWGPSFVHVFGSRKHELAWHRGTEKPSVTELGLAFCAVLTTDRGKWSDWSSLEEALRIRTRDFQTPTILPRPADLAPSAPGPRPQVGDFFPLPTPPVAAS